MIVVWVERKCEFLVKPHTFMTCMLIEDMGSSVRGRILIYIPWFFPNRTSRTVNQFNSHEFKLSSNQPQKSKCSSPPFLLQPSSLALEWLSWKSSLHALYVVLLANLTKENNLADLEVAWLSYRWPVHLRSIKYFLPLPGWQLSGRCYKLCDV